MMKSDHVSSVGSEFPPLFTKENGLASVIYLATFLFLYMTHCNVQLICRRSRVSKKSNNSDKGILFMCLCACSSLPRQRACEEECVEPEATTGDDYSDDTLPAGNGDPQQYVLTSVSCSVIDAYSTHESICKNKGKGQH